MKYDLVVVFGPDTKEKEAMDKVKMLLEKDGFKFSDESWWGKKRLAYPIKKHTEANYASFVLSAKSADPQQLGKKFRLENDILRYLVLKKKERKKN
jgi:small subunit ribosomal protein S6